MAFEQLGNRLDKPHELVLVGIGASAGGLKALQTVLANTPSDGNIAYVVVVHLSPDHESHLTSLLQNHSALPVLQVTEDVPIQANHVYVIPPGRNLSTIDTFLRLAPLEQKRRERAPIDFFFRTLADQHRERAIAVVLSGTGSDGAIGLSQVKEYGGLTIAQDPSEAEYSNMPENAIATGFVDLVLPLTDIPGRILRYAGSNPKIGTVELDDASPVERDVLLKILAQVRSRTEHDFTGYKTSTVTRRIARRMQLHGIEGLRNYLQYVRHNREEVLRLFEDLLITVTSFFRDADAFALLETEIIPKLFQGKHSDDQVRVWVVGCATGEEAYSLAMLLFEHASELKTPVEFQVFATDVYPASLDRAREGIYPKAIIADVSEERLKRFFIDEGETYRVRKELRERVMFAPHNLLSDPPFSKLDLLTCRNVLIYLKREVQQDIFRLFHYALGSSGYLFLGTSETAENAEMFREINKQAHIFRRIETAVTDLPNFPLTRSGMLATEVSASGPEGARGSYGALHQRIVERYAPPSLLVNQDRIIVHLSENAGRYLQNPGGEPTNDLLRRVRNELRVELRTAFYEAAERKEHVTARPTILELDGKLREVTMQVRPAQDELDGFALVIFDEREPIESERLSADGNDDQAVRQLENQLEASSQRLQTVVEEYETSREEMKASNEELQSINEELRSTAEELETSKEELQSINEELITLNQENRHKVEELSQLTSDLQNLFAATDIATLFLDRSFRINRFTPKITELFNVLPSDRGRPLAHITHRLGATELIARAEEVLKTLQPIEIEVQTQNAFWYLMRLFPYRTVEDRIDGIVLTFVDVTELKNTEAALYALNDTLEQQVEARTNELKRSNLRFSQAFTLAPFAAVITTLGRGETFLDVNQAFLALTGYTENEVLGKHTFDLQMWSSREDQRKLEEAQKDGRGFRDLPLKLLNKEKQPIDVLLSAEVIRSDSHEGYLKMFYDVTKKKRSDDELLQAVESLMGSTNWFGRELIARLNHVRSGRSIENYEAVHLSAREQEVLEHIAMGWDNKRISQKLGLKQQTVRNYVSAIFEKIGVHSRTEAAVWARERGLMR